MDGSTKAQAGSVLTATGATALPVATLCRVISIRYLPVFSGWNQTRDGNFHFTGTGAAGVTYELDAATNLAPPILWRFVTNAVAAQNGLFDLWDLAATNFQQRFYRITSSQ